jgi:ankyrin repeat protein
MFALQTPRPTCIIVVTTLYIVLVAAQTGSRSTPLHIAASRGHVAVLRVLIDAGIEVDARNEVSCGTSQFVVAVDRNLPYDLVLQNSCTALHWAARRSANVEIVKMLIAAGADVNAQDTMVG